MAVLSVQRDIFPLPSFDTQRKEGWFKLSQGTRRRLNKQHHWQAWCNDGIEVLNELMGHGPNSISEHLGGRFANASSESSYNHLAKQYRDFPEPSPGRVTGEAALSELLSYDVIRKPP